MIPLRCRSYLRSVRVVVDGFVAMVAWQFLRTMGVRVGAFDFTVLRLHSGFLYASFHRRLQPWLLDTHRIS